jgi:exodeoxyribonuclease V alpha subunit
MIRLDRSFRFEESGDIDILGDSVNKGDFDQSIAILKNKSRKSIRFEAISSQGVFLENLETLVVNGYKKYFKAENPVEALEQLGYFKILCALNKGKFGVEKINEAAEYFLVKAGLIKASEEWYRGRPVMILKNDYKLGLFNGDIGIIWPLKELNDKKPFAFFKTFDNEIRHFPPHRLPEHETVYAMTVHKSQGSEFEHVVLVLPENDAQVLTRELLYTGITRAKKSITIHGCEEIFKIALSRRIERHSGLKDRLWG